MLQLVAKVFAFCAATARAFFGHVGGAGKGFAWDDWLRLGGPVTAPQLAVALVVREQFADVAGAVLGIVWTGFDHGRASVITKLPVMQSR